MRNAFWLETLKIGFLMTRLIYDKIQLPSSPEQAQTVTKFPNNNFKNQKKIDYKTAYVGSPDVELNTSK